MKSKTTAYILWFFFGLLGIHKFYLRKTGIGILYMFTAGLFFVGWLIDLFTLGKQVEEFNTNPTPLQRNVPNKQLHKSQPSLEDIEDAREELGLPKGDVYHILYKDFNGNISERNIELLKSYEKKGEQYICAFCHTRLDIRTFRIDRITAMTHDKRRINNIWNYINNDFTPLSDIESLVAQALDD